MRSGQRLARDRAPRLEPFPPSGQRADTRFHTVRHEECCVEGEQRGDFRLVGLELLPGGPDGGLVGGGVLEFDYSERQAVDE